MEISYDFYAELVPLDLNSKMLQFKMLQGIEFSAFRIIKKIIFSLHNSQKKFNKLSKNATLEAIAQLFLCLSCTRNELSIFRYQRERFR